VCIGADDDRSEVRAGIDHLGEGVRALHLEILSKALSELEEAAVVAGASVWRRWKSIIFPLTTSGFVSGFLLTFITTMRELSLVILLVTRDTQVLASQTMWYVENNLDQMANIEVRSGQHCVHSWFNAKKITGSVRASLYFYNTQEEAALLVANLKKIRKVL
jgi:hypothetical protein